MKSPLNIGAKYTFKNLEGIRAPRFSVSKYMNAAPGTKFKAATADPNSMPKTSGPKKLSPGGGVRESTITNEGFKIPGTGPKPATYEIPGTGSTKVEKPKNVKPKNVKPKNVKPSSNTSTSNNTKPIKSHDSDKGGYKSNMTTAEFFGRDYSKELANSIAPMPKFERTVTNARSADYDLVRAKGRGRTSRLKSRLARRQGRVENRVDRSLARIDARQQRAGTKYAGKMKAAQIKSDKGKTDPGYFDSQKKLDAVGIRGSESPKATNTTGQKAAQGSIKLKPTMSKTQTLTDAQLNRKLNKPAVKKQNTGKTKSLSMTRGESQKSLTDLAMTGMKNPGKNKAKKKDKKFDPAVSGYSPSRKLQKNKKGETIGSMSFKS